MGTDRFMDDISAELRKFIAANKEKQPSVLIVSFEDALVWYNAARLKDDIRCGPKEFVELGAVKDYVQSLPWKQQNLKNCRITVLAVDSRQKTHFE
jgi:hypothetical protein